MDKKLSIGLAVGVVLILFLQVVLMLPKEKSFGSEITQQTSSGSYVDSADLKQNVQAIAERMTNLSQYQVLQADSSGRMQAVAASSLEGDIGGNLIRTGSVTALTTTTALTAAQFCDSSILEVNTALGTSTITFPATSTLFVDCLDTNGDSKTLTVYNASSATTTIMAAGAGGTAFYSSTLTIGTSDTATIEIIRQTASAYLMLVINQPS